jgi:hypothetical protein
MSPEVFMNATPEVPEESGAPDPVAPEADEGAEPEEDAEAPLNRAARRAKAKKSAPSHVGPQPEWGLPGVRSARPRTKRAL